MRFQHPLNLPGITLGTMNYASKGMNVGYVAQLLETAIDRNFTSIHSSSEYESFGLYTTALKNLPMAKRRRVRHIVKLACPHFGDDAFSASHLRQRVDSYLQDLNTDRLDVVQWMWRDNNVTDETRCEDFLSATEEIAEVLDELVTSGKVMHVACFPYSTPFMKAVRDSDLVRIQVNYVNFLEDDAQDARLEPSTIVLRPFAGGRVFKPDCKRHIEAQMQLHYPNIQLDVTSASMLLSLLKPEVASVVVGINSINRLTQCIETVERVPAYALETELYEFLLSLQQKIIAQSYK